MRRALLLWPGVVAAAVQLGRGSYVALVTPMDAANAVDYGAFRRVDGVAMPVPHRSTEPARLRHHREMT